MTAGRKHTSKNKEWNTPPYYVDLVNKFFNNEIDLDPCSNEHSMIDAKEKYILPQNGLKLSWEFNKIFVNPPYGRNTETETRTGIKHWIYKGYDAYIKYDSEILFLIPVATNTIHFKEVIFKHGCGICFLKDTRLKFWQNGKEDRKGAPMSCCIAYLGKDYDKFYNTFNECGKCFKI